MSAFYSNPHHAADADPLILTAQFDAPAAACFGALRQAHYPADLNRVPAHLTLFHKLPGGLIEEIEDILGEEAWQLDPLPGRAMGVTFTGRGVAIEIDSPALIRLRTRLAQIWSGLLTPQDRQRFVPHVTVQNKVPPSKARRTHMGLSAIFEPFGFSFEGLQLWHYRAGGWEEAGDFRFGGPAM